jgi:hypothetical protein
MHPPFLVISLKSVFSREIDCQEGFLVDIGAVGALKREKQTTCRNVLL